ncbi:MAG TPA: SDR family NAD(P)-dependent oxidoreductase, partial [Planctomycetota bacterium]|nr:SDR family NAD(P)-dependent oxidoreductase [Planctomycetota bacterium]
RGGDAVVPIPRERFDVEALYDPDPAAEGKLYVREAGLLADIAGFDAALFGISPREATMLDPQQRLLLETSWHAFEHANLPPASLRGLCVGVYVGTRASEYFDSQTHRTPADATSHYATGNAISTAAGRLSFTFGFTGPCYALDTACSGSLVAVHNAVRALRAGECDVALAGGVNAIFDPVPMAGLCRARMLAPDGRCKSFDARADGYGRGEGCGMIVLERLADAEANGHRILAVVRGSASNQDGRSGGLTVPHGPSQTAVVRMALADAGLAPGDIDYVEAHGTGTQLGDPIEIQALDEVFAGRERKLLVGSVKTNIGHLEAAAGISGLIKTVLALQHRLLPPTIHCRTPSPHIDWRHSVVDIVREPMPLPARDGPHFAGVSSFGFSGTNCHVVLCSPPAAAPQAQPDAGEAARGPWLLPLQAGSVPALRALARAHAAALARGDVELATWCRTAASARTALAHRAAFVGGTNAELAAALHAFAGGDDGAATATGQAAMHAPRIAFLFPGQGAQHTGMGEELARVEPVFGDALTAAAERLAGEGLPAPLHELLWHGDGSALARTDATQPALCAWQLAMLALLRSVGIVPDAVLGHSVGDYAAAVAAGVMDGSDALALCAARGRLMVEHCDTGGLLAVLAPLERWQSMLQGHAACAIAVHNAPGNVAVGGPPAALDALQRALEAAGIAVRRLPVSHAFHTAATEPMLAPFAERFAALRLRTPACTFVDCGAGGALGEELTTAQHWVGHVREPVRFDRGVRALQALDCAFWLELGPTAMLSALVAANGVRGPRVLPLQRAKRPARAAFLSALAELWVHGADVDLFAANHGRGRAHATLPGYPFQHQRVWLERGARELPPATGAHAPTHPLLGERQRSTLLQPGQAMYANRLSARAPAWLADHVAFGQVLFPAAGMIECALAAEHAAVRQLPVALCDAALRAPLVLDDDDVHVEAVRSADGSFVWSSSAGDDDAPFRRHLDGTTRSGGEPGAATAVDLAALRARCGSPLPPAELYARCSAAQLDYGERFRAVRSVLVGTDEAVAHIELAPELAAASFVLHPALLDACFHTLFAVLPAGAGTFLPIGVERVVVFRAGAPRAWCHTRCRPPSGQSRIADLDLFDEHGEAIASVRGLQLVPTDAATVRAASGSHRDLLYHVDFDTVPAVTGLVPVGGVAVLGDRELARALVAALPAGAGHACSLDELPAVLLRRRIDHIVFCAPVADGGDPMAAQHATFAAALATAQQALRAPGPPRLCFVTHGVQPAGPAPAGATPHAASLLGLRRTLALEHPALRPIAIDLDATVPANDVAHHAAALAHELQHTSAEPEVALRGGLRRAPRLRRGPRAKATLLPPPGPFRLRARAYGSFDHLQLEPLQRRAPGAGEVELAIEAAALNFKDALHVLGMLREHSERLGVRSANEQPLGFEGCGTVVAAGRGVDLRVGERVVVSAADCLASHVTVRASACFRLPAGIDATAAAGLPTVFATALHALEDLARVRAGETVLVHAAAGGVGQAAIQLLLGAGCRVLATASPAKHALVRELGAEIAGNSRTADFVDAVRAATGGRGVDVVLNTLSGEAVRHSFAVLAPGGRFVELGKLGVWTEEQAHAQRPDVAFFAFDLGDRFQHDATLQPRLLQRLRAGLETGELHPVRPTIVPLGQVRSAFQHLAQGRHVGKVVVQMPRSVLVRDDRTYLLTGGSGGIAPHIAAALVEAGARHIALLARGEVPAATLAPLRERGATVHTVQVDCSDRDRLGDALRRLRAAAPPIGGVVHAAGALADALSSSLTWSHASTAFAAKATGAIWLDESTAGDPLDFFVLLSSMAGTLGNPGQAAYAAANTFVDAFADWRRQRGRPAVAIAYGPWDGGGMASRLQPTLRERLRQVGMQFLPARTASHILTEQLGAHGNVVAMSMRWPAWLQGLGAEVPPLLRGMRERAASAVAVPAIDLTAVPPAARAATLAGLVKSHVAAALGFAAAADVDAERTFQEQGLDSLMAVDAKDRLEAALGRSLPATLLFDFPDVERLAAQLLGMLFPGDAGDAKAPDELESMATDDIARLLELEVRQAESRP